MSLELLSPFSDANLNADAHAFAALMRHIKEVDGQQHTVIMIQVENEVGMQGDSRDRVAAANTAYAGPVPKELMDYLQQHKETLIPELRKVWEAAGFKTSGTWEEVFGKSTAAEEIFMSWYFARYCGRVAEAGKAEYPIPMYVNAALTRRSSIADAIGKGHTPGITGFYFAVGGPREDVLDIWRAGAPQIDILSPDLGSPARDCVAFSTKYVQSGNPLFIPESTGGPEGAARTLYVFGRLDAIGHSHMGIDGPAARDNDLSNSYDLIAQLAPLISQHQGNGTMSAALLRGPNDPPQKIKVGNYTLEVAFLVPRKGAPLPENPPPAAAIFIAAGPDEYYAAGVGSGLTVAFSPNTPGPEHAGLLTVEEGNFVDGRWVAGRSLAGDDSDEGQYLVLHKQSLCCLPPTRTNSIQHFTLYRYR